MKRVDFLLYGQDGKWFSTRNYHSWPGDLPERGHSVEVDKTVYTVESIKFCLDDDLIEIRCYIFQ